MLHRLPKAALVLALTCSIGLHWAFFQSVAWMGMVISYSQDASLKEALIKTFDGRHPCPLCKEIAKSRRSEKKSPAQAPSKKFECIAGSVRFVFGAPRRFLHLRKVLESFKSLPITPPTPPPRGLFI